MNPIVSHLLSGVSAIVLLFVVFGVVGAVKERRAKRARRAREPEEIRAEVEELVRSLRDHPHHWKRRDRSADFGPSSYTYKHVGAEIEFAPVPEWRDGYLVPVLGVFPFACNRAETEAIMLLYEEQIARPQFKALLSAADERGDETVN